MRTIKQKRKQFMDTLTGIMDRLDPSGENSKKYQTTLNQLSDDEFDSWVRKWFNDPKANLYLEIEEFERDLTLDAIKDAAKFIGIPLYERVAIPYHTGDPDNVVVTPQPVPVGYCHIKRLQQTLMKKNSGSIHTEKRNPKTGQVINEDKNARNSDAETYSLVAIGAMKALEEMMGPRADNMKAKNQMNNAISRNGYVSLDELDNSPENKVAINTMDVYFTMQGFRTNLVGPMVLIPGPKIKGSTF